jgi:hypothetical protein
MRLPPIGCSTCYVVLYRSLPDGIELVRVVHGMRDLSDLARP